MYSITTTKAIVLKSHDMGEKDLFLSLFTKDLGQIYARVSGVRDLKSKHRYSVQEHSLIDVSLVQGKTGWRITNTGFIKSYYFELVKSDNHEVSILKRETILRILSLVKRMYLGGEANEKVFDDLLAGFEMILGSATQVGVELNEARTVVNFLYDLGYVSNPPNAGVQQLKELRKIINEGIRSSEL